MHFWCTKFQAWYLWCVYLFIYRFPILFIFWRNIFYFSCVLEVVLVLCQMTAMECRTWFRETGSYSSTSRPRHQLRVQIPVCLWTSYSILSKKWRNYSNLRNNQVKEGWNHWFYDNFITILFGIHLFFPCFMNCYSVRRNWWFYDNFILIFTPVYEL